MYTLTKLFLAYDLLLGNFFAEQNNCNPLYIGILPSRNILIGDFSNTFYRSADGTQTIGIFCNIFEVPNK